MASRYEGALLHQGPTLLTVEIHSTPSGLEFGIPHELFTSSTLRNGSQCDPAPDGQRFLCLVRTTLNPLDDQLTVLLNWRARLRQ